MTAPLLTPGLTTRIASHFRAAERFGPWDGRTEPPPRQAVRSPHEPELHVSLLLSYDVGYHASGWWRNSEYDRCWHLSLCHLDDSSYADMTKDQAQWWARAYFAEDARKAWLEPPASEFDPYRMAVSSRYVWHVRVFTDRQGHAIQPQGEVYNLVPYDDGSSPEKVFR